MNLKYVFPAIISLSFFLSACTSGVESDAKIMADLNCALEKAEKSIDSLQQVRASMMEEYQEKSADALKRNDSKELTDLMDEMKNKGEAFLKVDEELSQKKEIARKKARLQKKEFRKKYKDEEEILFKEKLLEFSKNCK